MIDQQARRQIHESIEGFTTGRISAFALDEQLQTISTEDGTAREVVRVLWFTYDDVKDHGPEVWSKPTWDFAQRLLLLLDSGAEFVDVERGWEWRASQAVAAVALIVVATLYWFVFHHWFFPVLIGGVASMGIAWWRRRNELDGAKVEDPADTAPFSSVSEITEALRRLPSWRKRQYPGRVPKRLRNPIVEGAYALLYWFIWCLCSPVALLAQSLPGRINKQRIAFQAQG